MPLRRWKPPIVGYSVIELIFGSRVVVRLSGGERPEGQRSKPIADLILYQHFHLSRGPSGEKPLEGPWEVLTRLLALRYSIVETATVDSCSGLAVSVGAVGRVTAWSGERYERWELTGSRSLKVVGEVRSREPAIWSELEPLGG